MSMGASSSQSQNQSQQSSESYIAPNQLGYLTNLWGQAQGQANPGAAAGAASAANQFTQPFQQQAMQALGGLTDPSAQIAAQSASLQQGLGQMWNEQLLPGIESNAIAAGGYGGGRQGVAQAQAAGQLGQAFTQGYGDIVARANQQALAAASAMPGAAQGYMQNQVYPTTAGFDPLARLAAILGSPTVLQQSQGTSSGSSSSSGFEFGII